jgi:hypothetical protein
VVSQDWIAYRTKMQKFTSDFVDNEVFAAVNDRQAIISVAFDTLAQVTVEAFNFSSMD